MQIIKTISKNIKKHWKGSLYELAKKADIPYSTLGNIMFEQKKDVNVTTLIKIAKALKITLDELVK